MSTQPQNSLPAARKKRKRNPTSGLLKDVLETLSPPVLEGSERDIVPKDLVYIGSYNWVDSPNPTIIVPGQLISLSVSPRFDAFRTSRYRVPSNMGR